MKTSYFKNVVLLTLFLSCSYFMALGVEWLSEYAVSYYLSSSKNPAVNISINTGVGEFSESDYLKISEALSVSKGIEFLMLVFGVAAQICIILFFALFFSRKQIN